MSAHLDGNYPLAGGNMAFNVVVRFFTPDTEIEIHKSAAIIDAGGNFDVYDAPVGTYDVGIKADGGVSELAEDLVFTEGNTTAHTFPNLRMGDLDGSDNVVLADLNLLTTNYGQGGTCKGYAGDWRMPECPSPPPPAGACYGYIIG